VVSSLSHFPIVQRVKVGATCSLGSLIKVHTRQLMSLLGWCGKRKTAAIAGKARVHACVHPNREAIVRHYVKISESTVAKLGAILRSALLKKPAERQ